MVYFQWRLWFPSEVGEGFCRKLGRFVLSVNDSSMGLKSVNFNNSDFTLLLLVLGHSGDPSLDCKNFLISKGATPEILVSLVKGVMQHATWVHRRKRLNALPVLPRIRGNLCKSLVVFLLLLDHVLVGVHWCQFQPMDTVKCMWPDLFF